MTVQPSGTSKLALAEFEARRLTIIYIRIVLEQPAVT